MGLQVEMDQGDLTGVKLVLSGIKNGYPKVQTRALNKTMTHVISQTAKQVNAVLNISQKRIKENITYKKANWSSLSMWVKSTGTPVNFASFTGVRKLKYGYSIQFRKGGTRYKFRHAFIWERPVTKKGKEVIAKTMFERQEYKSPAKKFRPDFPYGMLPKKYRLPLKVLDNVRIEDELAKPKVLNAVIKSGDEFYLKTFDDELAYELRKFA